MDNNFVPIFLTHSKCAAIFNVNTKRHKSKLYTVEMFILWNNFNQLCQYSQLKVNSIGANFTFVAQNTTDTELLCSNKTIINYIIKC